MNTKLKQWRTAQGLTLAEMADRLGIRGAGSKRTFQRYERGEAMPRTATVTKIIEVTGGAVTANDLYDACVAFKSHAALKPPNGCSPVARHGEQRP